ncbi:hypothetical protein OHT68_06385 [Streptomyces canus]|uniref:hypothetical protein n=1 Tax=Streptomyces canus TaxID=58343 RepID=UPI002E28668B|nr:hypothetical protein [Streptomyces canus]
MLTLSDRDGMHLAHRRMAENRWSVESPASVKSVLGHVVDQPGPAVTRGRGNSYSEGADFARVADNLDQLTTCPQRAEAPSARLLTPRVPAAAASGGE